MEVEGEKKEETTVPIIYLKLYDVEKETMEIACPIIGCKHRFHMPGKPVLSKVTSLGELPNAVELLGQIREHLETHTETKLVSTFAAAILHKLREETKKP